MATVLNDPHMDRKVLPYMLSLPSEENIASSLAEVNPDSIHVVHSFLQHTLAVHFQKQWLKLYDNNSSSKPYQYDYQDAIERKIKNTALNYLVAINTKKFRRLAIQQLTTSDNLTDSVAALQASSTLPGTINTIKRILKNPNFSLKNPNNIYALLATFAKHNLYQFNTSNGSGYKLLADQIIKLSKTNSFVAGILLSGFAIKDKLDPHRQKLITQQLQRIAAIPKLAENITEILDNLQKTRSN